VVVFWEFIKNDKKQCWFVYRLQLYNPTVAPYIK
jgi:hypothetical protein